METPAFTQWLDTACSGLDQAILHAVHTVQQSGADVVLGPLARLLDLLGEGGIALILLGLFLLAFPRTRKTGWAVLLALALGALCTNVLLKPWIARPRPYDSAARALRQWWLEGGGVLEHGFSFPSGHSTAAMAAMSALFFTGTKRRAEWLLFGLLMGLSRLYLVVHYPTDVAAGLLVGFAAGAAGARLAGRAFRG